MSMQASMPSKPLGVGESGPWQEDNEPVDSQMSNPGAGDPVPMSDDEPIDENRSFFHS